MQLAVLFKSQCVQNRLLQIDKFILCEFPIWPPAQNLPLPCSIQDFRQGGRQGGDVKMRHFVSIAASVIEALLLGI
jgi:hypothetical protein